MDQRTDLRNQAACPGRRDNGRKFQGTKKRYKELGSMFQGPKEGKFKEQYCFREKRTVDDIFTEPGSKDHRTYLKEQ
jgi:hypothetical protein